MSLVECSLRPSVTCILVVSSGSLSSIPSALSTEDSLVECCRDTGTGHVNTATHFLDFNSRIPAGPRTTFYTIGTAYFAYCWTLFIPGEPPGYLSLLASRGKFLPIVTGKG